MMRDPVNVLLVCCTIVVVAITAGVTAYNIAVVTHRGALK